MTEVEFADIYFQWIDPKNPPAGVTVTALPIQHSPVGDNILMELSFIVATNDSLPIKRYDVTRGCRMVEYDGMAYFTGPCVSQGGYAGRTGGGCTQPL